MVVRDKVSGKNEIKSVPRRFDFGIRWNVYIESGLISFLAEIREMKDSHIFQCEHFICTQFII